MEMFLWLILWLAFVLPVAKCLNMSSGMRLKDCIGFGLFWPVTLPAIAGGELLTKLILKLAAKLVYLIED